MAISTQYLKKISFYPRLIIGEGESDESAEDALYSNFKLSKLLSDFIQTSDRQWLQSTNFKEKLIQWYKNILCLTQNENSTIASQLLKKSFAELLSPQIFAMLALPEIEVFQSLFDFLRKFENGISVLVNAWQESFGEAKVLQMLNLILDDIQVSIIYSNN